MRSLRVFFLMAVLAGSGLACGGGGGPKPQLVNVSGSTRDYFSTSTLAGVGITVDGQGGVNAFSAAGGAYQVSNLLANSTYSFVGSLTNYRNTRNESFAVATNSVVSDVQVVSTADASRQYTGVGLTAASGTAIVIADLHDLTGLPRTGIPVANITLVNAAQVPVGVGPFVFAAAGDIVDNATLAVTTAFSNRSRIAFLDVPPGTDTLRVKLGLFGLNATITIPVVTSAGGATLVQR